MHEGLTVMKGKTKGVGSSSMHTRKRTSAAKAVAGQVQGLATRKDRPTGQTRATDSYKRSETTGTYIDIGMGMGRGKGTQANAQESAW